MKYAETLFDIAYLILVIALGIQMIRKATPKSQYTWFGVMAIVLGCGDAFHLIPRIYAMWTTGMEDHAAALGFGQAVTSVTMTVFYVILYHIWVKRYHVENSNSTRIPVYLLAVTRIVLCLFPQNDWLSADAPVSWGIYRNIPFALLGLLIIVLFYMKAKQTKDTTFRFMWLAITLSFGFYIPVVLFAKTFPLIGVLMIPKTCAYVWVVWMGSSAMKKEMQNKA